MYHVFVTFLSQCRKTVFETFPRNAKNIFLQHCYKMLQKCDDYFFDPITFSRHFYDNLIKMLKMYKFAMNDLE